ncbi:MAG: hypothetical protein KKE62_08105 [Proteobacteria bacterium]|nr:hypothetical protein [Pseudomonadota bacterium]MBU1388379.1 hypothetical protein [Pseudomonadota bacterium]MBU1542797.1 hypothetical protein [Pseudomonadota bacterium]MBU2481309.1 hypothetical protein [Pseudomonadota bacterium]
MAQVIAHRGARSLAPENTLLAADLAYKTGADLWETDVSLTRDGRLVLFHDETLLRCTNAASRFPSNPSYRVRDFDLKALLALDAGSFFVETDPFSQISLKAIPRTVFSEYRHCVIPTLEQGLEFTMKKQWKINLELKYFPEDETGFFVPDKTLEVIEQMGILPDRVVISSFNHGWLERVIDKKPQIEVQALIGENDTDPLDFGDFRYSTYNINAKPVDDGIIKKLKDLGKKVNLFTVNNKAEFDHYASLGVDGMFTDFPQLFCSGTTIFT